MSKLNRNSIFIILGCCFLVALFSAVVWGLLDRQTWKESSLDRIRQRRSIRIGYAVEAPYAFPTSDGRVTGEAAEVAKQVVYRIGIPNIRWVQSDFSSLLSHLESGRFDVVASGMYITRERAKRASFSNPSFHVTQGLLVTKGNPQNLDSYEKARDLKDVRIAVIGGALEGELLRTLGVPENRLVVVPDALTGRVAVESGEATALALSLPTIRWTAQNEGLGKTEIAQPFRQPHLENGYMLGFGAFVFRKEDKKLRAAWNEALKNFINSPEHLRLISQFGFTKDNLPGTTTAREVLSVP